MSSVLLIKKDNYFICYGVILLVLFTIASGSIALSAISATFFMVIVVFLDKWNLFLLIVFLIPSQRFFVVESSDITLINLYFVYLFFIYFFVFKINISKVLLLLMYILLVFVSIGSFYHLDFMNVVIFLKFSLVVFVIYATLKKEDIYFQSKTIWSFILGVFFMLLFSFIFGDFSFSSRFSAGDINDANYIALLSAVSIALILVFHSLGKINKASFYFMSLFFLFSGIATQSRSFLLMLFVIFIFYIIRSLINSFFKTIMFLVPAFLLLSYYFIAKYESVYILNVFSQRILKPRGDDLSGGRLSLWSRYLEILFSDNNFIFGVGPNVRLDYNIEAVSHNFLIGNLVSFGFFGTILFYSVFIYLFRRYVGNIKNNFFGLLPLTVFLTGSITLHSFLGAGGIISILICILSMSLYKKSSF